jgi:hypothetical protein
MELVAAHKAWPTIAREQRFRLTLCGHKALEAGAVCLVLMVQGHLTAVTLAHLLIACKTGILAVSPALAITFSPYARQFVNRMDGVGFSRSLHISRRCDSSPLALPRRIHGGLGDLSE